MARALPCSLSATTHSWSTYIRTAPFPKRSYAARVNTCVRSSQSKHTFSKRVTPSELPANAQSVRFTDISQKIYETSHSYRNFSIRLFVCLFVFLLFCYYYDLYSTPEVHSNSIASIKAFTVRKTKYRPICMHICRHIYVLLFIL